MTLVPLLALDTAALADVDPGTLTRLRGLVRRRRCRGVLLGPSWPSPAQAAALRRVGLVVGVRSTPAALQGAEVAALVALARSGPVLLVLEGSLGVAVLTRAVARVARLRLPTLRLSLHDVPACHGAPAGDVPVQVVPLAAAAQPHAPVSWQPACAACGARDRCAGPRAGAVVRPLPAAVSNQFDLVVAPRALTGTAGAGASAPPAVSLAAAARAVWVESADGGGLARCDNAGWPDAALREVLDELGQLWLDVSHKARLDDFAADLRPLQQLAPARPLPSGQVTPSRWRVAEGDPFAVEEAHLLAALTGLVGTVVDIGAGPVRYLRLLADRIASGEVRYLAVEPDTPALVRSGEALPGARLARGVGEHLPVQTGVADHVLMLRSFNHLRDVGAAFAEASRVAASGATLLVVDNVAFGLVRTAAQVARARAVSVAETPFEHFRNANADAAVAAVEATGCWRVTGVRAVRPGRANQWCVQAVRRARAPAAAPAQVERPR